MKRFTFTAVVLLCVMFMADGVFGSAYLVYFKNGRVMRTDSKTERDGWYIFGVAKGQVGVPVENVLKIEPAEVADIPRTGPSSRSVPTRSRPEARPSRPNPPADNDRYPAPSSYTDRNEGPDSNPPDPAASTPAGERQELMGDRNLDYEQKNQIQDFRQQNRSVRDKLNKLRGGTRSTPR